jgi:SAM-dependent methyltransferase
MRPATPSFDLIARPYRWLEYLTFGKSLETCRTHFLPQLLDRRHALVLGDGNGRFLAQLLKQSPNLYANAVDNSAAMLQLLRQRCEAATPNAAVFHLGNPRLQPWASIQSGRKGASAPGVCARLRTHLANAITFPLKEQHDLVVTHFFLDCLTQPELNTLITRIAPTLAPGALWLISDFRIPTGPMRIPAKLLIRSLYFAFRILTGLRTTRLPDHTTPLTQAGLTRISHQHHLGGLLTTEIWQT